ncbi:MAG: hypothetical protein SGBAC_003688 [Bacillariaceae sp.]
MLHAVRAYKLPLGVSSPPGSSLANSNLKFQWCETASVNEAGKVVTESIKAMQELGDQMFDRSQSSQWMEYIERKEDRFGDEGGAGAYDTMRCDIVFPIASIDESQENVVVWGEDFHLSRLKRSYTALHKQQDAGQEFEEAIQESKTIMNHLLSLAKADAKAMHDLKQMESNGETFIVIVRLTMLWSPPKRLKSGISTPPKIRGHACSTFQLQCPSKVPSPMTASLAVQLREDATGKNKFSIDNTMPTRHADPQNKIASWCRERTQLQVNSKKSIEEVLMVREREDDKGAKRLEILEGSSSNFFVILKDGTVRTATEGCLHGYVRHQVLSLLDQCGLKFDPTPIFIDESNEWKEAFITSSSRLIYPIDEVIIIPSSRNENEAKQFWQYEKSSNAEEQEMQCLALRKQMLRSSGYTI